MHFREQAVKQPWQSGSWLEAKLQRRRRQEVIWLNELLENPVKTLKSGGLEGTSGCFYFNCF